MSVIHIILCVNWINDRSAAIAFEEISKPYFRKIEELTQSGKGSGQIETIYIRYDFDPVMGGSPLAVQFDRYRKKKREAEATIEIHLAEFEALSDQARRHRLAHRMTEAIHLIGKHVAPAAAEMAELIVLLNRFHAAEIPGYQPRRNDESFPSRERAAEFSSGVNTELQPSTDQIASGYQLVMQCSEELFDEHGTLELLEAAIEKKLRDGESLDGHDVGGGKLNFFFVCVAPEALFKRIVPVLKRRKLLNSAILAYSEAGEDEYTVLWPPSFDRPFEL